MAWPVPQYSRSAVRKAGRLLAEQGTNSSDIDWAQGVLSNWRSCHGYPINTFQATLRAKLRTLDRKAFVVQRLKRTPSIIEKLRRYPSMKLITMQDIGGLRAVVSSLTQARKLEASYRRSRFKHQLFSSYDYIVTPKDSGYRSLHLIYRYRNPIAPEYDGLLLELQIRSRLQHSWATAVETMGTFFQQALKASEGPEEWLDFFAITGSAFAILEKSRRVPGYEAMGPRETFRSVTREAKRLDVHNHLRAYSIAADAIASDRKSGSYFLVVLNMHKRTVSIRAFGKQRLDDASNAYTLVEGEINSGAPLQAVLVSAESVDVLRRGYPNYFLDSAQFLKNLNDVAART